MQGEAGDTLWDDVIALKRERILEEAANLFYERGYKQTSVAAIAKCLGATKPFVYYHFKSKVDLLVEICERSTGDTVAATDWVVSRKGSPRDRLEQFVGDFTNVALKDHKFVAIYFREEINLPKNARDRINKMRKTLDSRLHSLLKEGVATGDFEIDDPRMCTLVIAGMSSYAFAWYREGGRLEREKLTTLFVKMAMKMVSSTAALEMVPSG